ncbi:MAG: dynamin family protein [Saccharofermentans sp.]|nr:dynamin family protein [Saccharofermentans sp.]
MNRIKIISNPYENRIQFFSSRKDDDNWIDVKVENPNSKLLNEKIVLGVFPFVVRNIVSIVCDEYLETDSVVDILFEGTSDEYKELKVVCSSDEFCNKARCSYDGRWLNNARDILPSIISIYNQNLGPLIINNVEDKSEVNEVLSKFSDASSKDVPLCIVGNYSAGKSSFINSLIGSEILPSGDEPVTAKIYEIKQSSYPDRAKLSFVFNDQRAVVDFEDGGYRISTNWKDFFWDEISSLLANADLENIPSTVNKLLQFINSYKCTEKERISDVIELEVPFSGVLGSANSPFVIFDTPGSNSASNLDHLEILKEAMHNLSNGLPIYLSEYNSLDSTDNEKLYHEISDIKELDSRFAMIVVNKADTARLPSEGYSDKFEERILNYTVPRNLYSEGVYFVSSILGLGSKTGGKFEDEYYAEVFYDQERKYSDKNHPTYKTLYQYNILPKQLRDRMIEDSQAYDNTIYANSGLYAIEKELLTFASKYSPYNKCQQSLLYLRKAIEKSEQSITIKTSYTQKLIDRLVEEFTSDKEALYKKLVESSQKKKKEAHAQYITAIDEYTMKVTASEYASKSYFDEKYKAIRETYLEQQNIDEKRAELQRATNTVKWYLTTKDDNASFKDTFTAMFKATKDTGDTIRTVNRLSSEELIKVCKQESETVVNRMYETIENESKMCVDRIASAIKDELLRVISGDSHLEASEKKDLQDVILSFNDIDYKTDADKKFVKRKLEMGINIFGIVTLFSDEQISTTKLLKEYNKYIYNSNTEIRILIEKSHYNSFVEWNENLISKLREKLAEYNPQLHEQQEIIKSQEREIQTMERNLLDLNTYSSKIEELLDWHGDENVTEE